MLETRIGLESTVENPIPLSGIGREDSRVANVLAKLDRTALPDASRMMKDIIMRKDSYLLKVRFMFLQS